MILKTNILFLNFLLILLLRFNSKFIKLKIAICTMGKKENLYAKEFVDYYKKLGINHIFIYDDNDPNTEKISDVIDKTYKKFVTIYESSKSFIKNQKIAFTKCYNDNKNKYDWIFMIDMDEYLVIVNNTLNNYLTNDIFKKCDFIKIHWVKPTDNNLLFYDNRSLFERFKGPYLNDTHIKTLVRGNIDYLKYSVHSPYKSPKRNVTCNNIGKKINYKKLNFQDIFDINIDKAYIIHFKYKSTEEYINKYKRGYRNWVSSRFLPKRIIEYFKNNKITLKKIEFIEKKLKLDLSIYKNKIKSKNKKEIIKQKK